MALTDSLISYWSLDEASGNAADAHGSNTLFDNNSVGAATGRVNGGRDFEATSTQWLNHVDNDELSQYQGDFTLQAWVNIESMPATDNLYGMVGKFVDGASEYLLFLNNASGTIRFYWIVTKFDTTTLFVAANTFGTPSLATWYHVIGYHDYNTEIGISINNGPVDTSPISSLLASSSTDFEIGRYNAGTGNKYFDGIIDEVGWWKRMLTTQERTDLYNGGSGLAYPLVPSTSAAVKVGSMLAMFQ